jgi:hypothetical protein
MVLDELKEWLYGCTHCGTCKDVLSVFTPACSDVYSTFKKFYPIYLDNLTISQIQARF